jgi:hypothetical protein
MTESRELTATVSLGTLRVSTRLDSDSVVVEVADTGTGMSPETQEHAFDPFFTTKGVGQGTGLGLDISRRIVERHSGDITVESHPGRTVFRVRLPTAAMQPVGTPGQLAPDLLDARRLGRGQALDSCNDAEFSVGTAAWQTPPGRQQRPPRADSST